MDYCQVGHWSVQPVSTGASTEEFSSTAFRDHLRLPTSSEDSLLGDKLAAARRRIEARTSRPYYRAQFDMAVDQLPADGSPIRLPRFPAVSVDSVWTYASDGSSSQFGSSGWFLDTYSEPPRLCLNSGFTWPSGRRPHVAAVIRFTAGYSTGNTTDGRGVPSASRIRWSRRSASWRRTSTRIAKPRAWAIA
jgi:uncharacterized phiE125 gp8 family phage protein